MGIKGVEETAFSILDLRLAKFDFKSFMRY